MMATMVMGDESGGDNDDDYQHITIDTYCWHINECLFHPERFHCTRRSWFGNTNATSNTINKYQHMPFVGLCVQMHVWYITLLFLKNSVKAYVSVSVSVAVAVEFCVLCAVCCVPCAVCRVLCAVCCVQN